MSTLEDLGDGHWPPLLTRRDPLRQNPIPSLGRTTPAEQPALDTRLQPDESVEDWLRRVPMASRLPTHTELRAALARAKA